jgi:alkanesulfonate monooxygenase SsuD/methylene tetrahydromethanopterin reductase-like flavin-dependent oxidoreductase (luciferase family)
MKFYYFGGNFNEGEISRLERHHFDGVMFVYDAVLGDVFTKVAKDIRMNEKIKYLVAIRPYAISPQYLCMIGKSINLIMPNRLQVNLISGYIKDHEANFGGIIGEVNDSSKRIDRSNYLIDYVNALNTMPGNQNKPVLDFYTSTTNEYVFDATAEYNNKIILPYRDYKNGHWTVVNGNRGEDVGNTFDITGRRIMLAITPIIRSTQEELDKSEEYAKRPIWKNGEDQGKVTDIEYFTYEEFYAFIKKLESDGIYEILMNGHQQEERERLISFIKEYRELKMDKNVQFHNKTT